MGGGGGGMAGLEGLMGGMGGGAMGGSGAGGDDLKERVRQQMAAMAMERGNSDGEEF